MDRSLKNPDAPLTTQERIANYGRAKLTAKQRRRVGQKERRNITF